MADWLDSILERLKQDQPSEDQQYRNDVLAPYSKARNDSLMANDPFNPPSGEKFRAADEAYNTQSAEADRILEATRTKASEEDIQNLMSGNPITSENKPYSDPSDYEEKLYSDPSQPDDFQALMPKNEQAPRSLEEIMQRASKPQEEQPKPEQGKTQNVPPAAAKAVRDYLTKKYGFSEELSDEALKGAQDNARYGNLAANFGRAIATGGATMSGVGADTGLYDNLAKQANKPVENLMARREGQKEEFKYGEEQRGADRTKALIDPNSADSQDARDQLFSLFPEYAQDPRMNKLSFSQIKEFFPMLQLKENIESRKAIAAESAKTRESNAELAREARQDEGKRKDKNFGISKVKNYQDSYNKETKELNDTLAQVQNIEKFTDEATKNPLSASQIGVQVAKAMGEKGMLSETDVTRYIQNKALAAKVTQELQSMASGTLTPENAKYLKESMHVLGQMYKNRQEVMQNKHVKQMARALDIKDQRARYLFGLSDVDAADPDTANRMADDAESKQSKSVEAPQNQPKQIKVRSKADGRVKLLDADKAQRILSESSDKYEEVQ